MTDTLAAALITVGGMLGVATLSAVTQFFITKRVVNSEHRKIAEQIRGESIARTKEKRIDKLREVIADFITLVDPDSNRTIDVPRMNSLIHMAELLFDRTVEEEKNLNAILIRIGVFISGYEADSGPVQWLNSAHRTDSLRLLGQFSDQAKAVFARHNR